MFLLTKELNKKDRNLKSPLLITSNNEDKVPRECIWLENGFYKDVKSDFTIFKNDFPENTLIYINKAQLTFKKNPIINSNYFILVQIIPLPNPPQDLENYVYKESKVKIYLPLYDTPNGSFKGIKQTLTHIVLRDDKEETFFTYGYSRNLSKMLYFYSKQTSGIYCLT